MKKLTTEKCKSVIEGFKWMVEEGPGMSIRDEYDLQAYEIALPVLEGNPIGWEEEIETMQKEIDSTHKRRVVWRDRATAALAKLELLEQQGGWISCSERMPDKYYVLAADFKNRYSPSIPCYQVGIFADWFDDGKPSWDDGDGNDLHLRQVTHWQPLPSRPEDV